MRNFRPILLASALLLAASCALLSRTYHPPHASKDEAAEIKFPWGTPYETVILTGVWLRAVTIALDDFLPEEEAARAKADGEEAACLARRDNYHVEAFVWSPRATSDAVESDAVDGGAAEVGDGGSSPEADAGHQVDAGLGSAWSQPGMPEAPPVIYVTITLLPGRCDLLGSPLMDAGATYVIDTVNWRILAHR